MSWTRNSGGVMCCLAVLVAALATNACGGSAAGPGGALDSYSNALDRGDFARAYELMSSSFRERHSKKEFMEMMVENPREVDETAARLRNPRKEMKVTAEFRYGHGDRMKLVREGGRWRIDSNPIQFYSQETPRDALRSFVRAYRLKRWDVMLRFVPSPYRELMDEDKVQRQFEGDTRDDIDETMNQLEAAIDEEIKDNGIEARMKYADGKEVEFVRQDDLWKIKDLD